MVVLLIFSFQIFLQTLTYIPALLTHLGGWCGGGGGVKPLVHSHCVLNAKRGRGGPDSL